MAARELIVRRKPTPANARTGNGFGSQLGDVVAAQIVSLPAGVAVNRAAATIKMLLLWLAGVFLAFYLAFIVIVLFFISRLVPAQAAPSKKTQ
jgi:tellurite resistance protein TehA-like permease